MDLRSIQKPFKEKYRSDPTASRITLSAQGSQEATPMACSIDIGRSWRSWHGCLLRRPAAWGPGRLCAAHLPDGGYGYGHIY